MAPTQGVDLLIMSQTARSIFIAAHDISVVIDSHTHSHGNGTLISFLLEDTSTCSRRLKQQPPDLLSSTSLIHSQVKPDETRAAVRRLLVLSHRHQPPKSAWFFISFLNQVQIIKESETKGSWIFPFNWIHTKVNGVKFCGISVLWFLCNLADNPTKKRTNIH